MRKNPTFISLAVIVVASTAFSACIPGLNNQPSSSSNPETELSTTVKQGTTTKTGKITRAGDKYFLEQLGKLPLEIDSYTVELSNYLGQSVTVSGQYSGDTLFVGNIK